MKKLPGDKEGRIDTVGILTSRLLFAGSQIKDFDTRLGRDRIAKTKPPGQNFPPVILLFVIQGGFSAGEIASTRCCPEPWAKSINEVSLEGIERILLKFVSIEKIIVFRVEPNFARYLSIDNLLLRLNHIGTASK